MGNEHINHPVAVSHRKHGSTIQSATLDEGENHHIFIQKSYLVHGGRKNYLSNWIWFNILKIGQESHTHTHKLTHSGDTSQSFSPAVSKTWTNHSLVAWSVYQPARDKHSYHNKPTRFTQGGAGLLTTKPHESLGYVSLTTPHAGPVVWELGAAWTKDHRQRCHFTPLSYQKLQKHSQSLGIIVNSQAHRLH